MKPTILFLCVHNAGRSQMAAAYARMLGGDEVVVYSAGTSPSETLNATVLEAMNEVGIDLSAERPTKLTEAMGLSADVIVTMGCGDECPYYPGKRYDDWDVGDPKGQMIEVVRDIRDDVRGRVERLLKELLNEHA